MEINAMNHTETPTFYTKETKSQKFALHEEDSSIFQRARGTTRKRIDYSNNKDSSSGKQDEDDEGSSDDADDGDDEKVEVKRKIAALQRIVPGGENLGADQLFEETAVYILALQCQIRSMKALASFIESVDKEKRKLGG